MDQNRNYCSFMLRMKQLRTGDPSTWVVSIQDTHSGQQQIFSNVDGLIQFLQAEFGSSPDPKDASPSVVSGTPGMPLQ